MVQVVILCGGVRTPIDVLDPSDFDVFKFQVMSLTDIAPDDQYFSVRGNNPTNWISLRSLNDGDVITVSRAPPPSGGGAFGGGGLGGELGGFGGGFGGGDDDLAAAIAASLGMAAPPATVPSHVVPFSRRQHDCTRVYLGSEEAVQPYREFLNQQTGMLEPICASCARRCRPFGLQSNTTPSFINTPFVCQCNPLRCLSSYRLTGMDILYGQEFATFKDQLLEKAEEQQSQILQPNHDQFRARVEGSQTILLMYEDPALQASGREVVPVEVIQNRAKEMRMHGLSDYSESDEFVRELNRWFKHEFFSWVDTLKCENCGSTTVNSGIVPTSAEEQLYRAGRTELHTCPNCNRAHRFPRYNHPAKLLETKRGRCGEFANMFTFLCRCFGYQVRQVQDNKDHVWTEFYSVDMDRWVHADACEAAFDAPLMYEQGWGKSIEYVTAIGAYEAADVTKRYTQDYNVVKTKRKMLSELWLRQFFSEIRGQWSSSLGDEEKAVLADRHAKEQSWLENIVNVKNRQLSEAEQRGRTTGSWEWRKARGELGEQSEEKQSTLFDSSMKQNSLEFLTVVPSIDGGSNLGLLSPATFDTSISWMRCGGLQIETPDLSAFLGELTVTRSRAGYISSLECSYHSKCSTYATHTTTSPRYGTLTYGDDVEERVFFNPGHQRVVGARVISFKTKERVVGFSVIVEDDFSGDDHVFYLGMKEEAIYNDDYEIEKYSVPRGHTIVSFVGAFEKDELVWIRFCYAPYAPLWQRITSQIKSLPLNDANAATSINLVRTVVSNATKNFKKYHTLKKSNAKLNEMLFCHPWAVELLSNCGFEDSNPDVIVDEKEREEAVVGEEKVTEEVKNDGDGVPEEATDVAGNDDENVVEPSEPQPEDSTSATEIVEAPPESKESEQPDEGVFEYNKDLAPVGTLRYVVQLILGLQQEFNEQQEDINLDVHSFGCVDPTGARTSWIKVNGHSYRINEICGGRGHGIVAFSPVGRTIVDFSATFDTFGDDKSGVEMSKFLRKIPQGHVVVICAHDSAENHWRPAEAELAMLGIDEAHQPQHRNSFVAIAKHLGCDEQRDPNQTQPEWAVVARRDAGAGPLRIKVAIPKEAGVVSPLMDKQLPVRLCHQLRTIGARFYYDIIPGEKKENEDEKEEVPNPQSSETVPEEAKTSSAVESATEAATDPPPVADKAVVPPIPDDGVDRTVLFVEPVCEEKCGERSVREFFVGHYVIDRLKLDYPFSNTGVPVLSFDDSWSDEDVNMCIKQPEELEFVDTVGKNNMQYAIYEPVAPRGYCTLGVVFISMEMLGYESPLTLPADAFFPNLVCVSTEFVKKTLATGFSVLSGNNSTSLFNPIFSLVIDPDDEKNAEDESVFMMCPPQLSRGIFPNKHTPLLNTNRIATSNQKDEFTPFDILKEQIYIPPSEEADEEAAPGEEAGENEEKDSVPAVVEEAESGKKDEEPPSTEPGSVPQEESEQKDASPEEPQPEESSNSETTTSPVLSKSSEGSSSVNSPRSKESRINREKIEKYMKLYFKMLRDGCGNESCTNPRCKTVSGVVIDPNKAAKTAILLANDGDEELCESLRI